MNFRLERSIFFVCDALCSGCRKLPLCVSFWKQCGLEIYPRDYQIDWHSFYAQNRLTTIWSNHPVLALELTDWWLLSGPSTSTIEVMTPSWCMGWATKQSHPPFTLNTHPPQKHQQKHGGCRGFAINLRVRRKPTPSVPHHTPWTFSSPQWKGGGRNMQKPQRQLNRVLSVEFGGLSKIYQQY